MFSPPPREGKVSGGGVPRARSRGALSPSMLPWQFPQPPLTTHDADTPSPPAAAPIVHVMSLGSLCCTARFMEAHGLRVYAGPFDWVFSDARMVTHCLKDGFESFLDRSQLQPNGGRPSHALYSTMTRHRTIFNHHNPLASEEHHAHFVRCAARFSAVLACPDPKLLLLVSKPATQQPKSLDLHSVRALPTTHTLQDPRCMHAASTPHVHCTHSNIRAQAHVHCAHSRSSSCVHPAACTLPRAHCVPPYRCAPSSSRCASAAPTSSSSWWRWNAAPARRRPPPPRPTWTTAGCNVAAA